VADNAGTGGCSCFCHNSCPCVSGDSPLTDLGYNIDDEGSCGFAGIGANGQTLGDHVVSKLDPKGLQNNGGPTDTIALQIISPAIDAIPNAQCPATDQRGFPRLYLVRLHA
jgi:hypothetical protein